VDSSEYLLACSRYIELNPVRARMVASPEEYRWSSCQYRLGLDSCDWLDDDPCYLALGTNEPERIARYAAFLRAAIPDGEWRLIRDAVQRGHLTGSGWFVEEVEAIIGKRIEKRSPGRPSKESNK
jgi:putative transposase